MSNMELVYKVAFSYSVTLGIIVKDDYFVAAINNRRRHCPCSLAYLSKLCEVLNMNGIRGLRHYWMLLSTDLGESEAGHLLLSWSA